MVAQPSPEEPAAQPAPAPAEPARPNPKSFEDVIALARSRREAIVAAHLVNDVHLVSFAEGAIEFRPDEDAPRDLAGRLGNLLQDWTGRRWVVSVSGETGAPSIRHQQDRLEANLTAVAMEDPLVKSVMATFPGAKVIARRNGTMVPPQESFAPPSGDDRLNPEDLPIDDEFSIDE